MEENETTQELELETEIENDELETENVTPEQGIDWKATALRYKNKLKKVNTSKAPAQQGTSNLKTQLDRLELRQDGYSDEAIDFISKVGGKEALKDEHVKAAVASIQQQRMAEQAVVASETSKSEIERKYSPEEISAMSPEELYKVLPKARK